MSTYRHSIGATTYRFEDLRDLMAKASPERAGDALAGVIAATDAERVAAQSALADLPIRIFLTEAVVPYEDDAVTRLIIDDHDADAFAPVTHLTVGDFLNWLLSEQADTAALRFRPSGVQAVVSGTPAGE